MSALEFPQLPPQSTPSKAEKCESTSNWVVSHMNRYRRQDFERRRKKISFWGPEHLVSLNLLSRY